MKKLFEIFLLGLGVLTYFFPWFYREIDSRMYVDPVVTGYQSFNDADFIILFSNMGEGTTLGLFFCLLIMSNFLSVIFINNKIVKYFVKLSFVSISFYLFVETLTYYNQIEVQILHGFYLNLLINILYLFINNLYIFISRKRKE